MKALKLSCCHCGYTWHGRAQASMYCPACGFVSHKNKQKSLTESRTNIVYLIQAALAERIQEEEDKEWLKGVKQDR